VSKKAVVRYDLAPAVPPVKGDATQLRQVVMNLITNASDALDDHPGTVIVSTGIVDADPAYLAAADLGEGLVPGRYVYVEVTDTGCGMDAETRNRVFDPFFTTKQTGRGLGLAAVLGIVRGHKGGLKLRSQPGRGTTFVVFFPASDAPYADLGQSADPAALPGAALSGKILVVDDDAMVLAATQDMLEDFGFSVLTAADGAEGVETLTANLDEVAAVILDMTMPRMNGEEALGEMRRARPDLPVILCSGFNEQDVAERHAEERFSRFLHKPYRAKDLLGALDAVLGAESA
ncbi:MAG: ATP-binding protein, partial [Deferrisomatales bacterium]